MTAFGGPILLSADRSLMADWPLLLDGMAAASQTTTWSSRLMWPAIAPPVAVEADGLRARQGPLGLRRIEAALRRDGFAAGDVALVPPERLLAAIGPATRLVGLSSGDPLGRGMNSTTMAAVFGGRPITCDRFQDLLARVRRRIADVGGRCRVLVGGPGAWQLAGEPGAAERLGIDHVITGYAEANIADVARRLVAGDDLPAMIDGAAPDAADIPPVAGATVMGSLEVSRGCGWGCDFCTLAATPMVDLPEATILADGATNLAAGVRNLSLASEDFFRYGARRAGGVDPDAVLALARRLAALDGVASLAIDHANITSIAAFPDDALAELRRTLALGRSDLRVWVNLGVETAAGELLARSGGRAKMGACDPADWAELCRRQVDRLTAAGFFPLVSLVLGLDGETPENLERTRRWVDALDGQPLAVTPMLLAPLRDGHDAEQGALTRGRIAVLQSGMRRTLDRMPPLYWRHHGAAGVAPWRRVLKQFLGRGYAVLWRWRLWLAMREAER